MSAMSHYTELRAKVLARFEGQDYDPDGPLVFVWHLHHAELLEIPTEPIVKRIDHVIEYKDASEIPTRLEWMRRVLGPLPPGYVEVAKACAEAWKAAAEASNAAAEAGYAEAWKAAAEAWKAAAEARKAYGEAGKVWRTELEALHSAELPDCPWNGETLVFPAAH